LSVRDPKAEAAVLARNAADDAKAMQLLAPNQEISERSSASTLNRRSRSGEPLERQAVVRLVEEVSEWADAQLDGTGSFS
jgi:hypothetical protein